MPFKMIALRTLYNPDDRRDYKKDQSFSVRTEKERDRLIRAKRARVDETKPTGIKTMKAPEPVAAPEPAPAPEIVQKVETAAPEALPNPFPSTEPVAPRARYRRADMKAED